MKNNLLEALKEGEFPLLTSRQLQFLEEVNTTANETIENTWYSTDNDDRASKVMLKIFVIEGELTSLIKHLSTGRSAKLRFAKMYPKWEKNRKDCIVQLREIASSLNSDRFNCNVSRLVGYSTSLVGGTVSLVSAILIPFTLGLTTPLAIAGGAATVAGAGTAIVTSITEFGLLKSRMDRAKELIEEDQKYFEDMSDWLTHASELQEALNSVLSHDIMKDIKEDIKKFVEKAIAIEIGSDRKILINETVRLLIRNFIKSLGVPLIGIVRIISVLVTVFLLLLNTENRLVFDCASVTIKSILGIYSLVDDSIDAVRLSSLFARNAAAAKDLAKAVTRGAVAVLGMVLDVAGIVYTSVDIYNGSLNPEAKKIDDAAQKMKEEADILKKVYENLPPRHKLHCYF